MSRFLIIGDKCNDVFVYGEVKRLSPEAPVPIFTPIRYVKNGGMAANVHNNLSALVENKDFVIGHFSTVENTKKRYVDEKTNHYFLRVDECDYSNRIKIEKHFVRLVQMCDCIVLSDYDKGFINQQDIIEICALKKPGAVVFIDTKKKITKEILDVVDFIKLNQHEYENNLPPELYNQYLKKIIITKGSDGAYYNNKTYETKKMVTADVSGAGDTFLAALSWFYMKKMDIDGAIKFANDKALEVVTKRGVSTI